MEQKIILVIEDDEQWFNRMKGDLKYFLAKANKKAKIIHAETQEEAWDLFKKHNPNIIIMDICVPGSEVSIQRLTKRIVKDGYSNPIITVSSSSRFNYFLLK